MTKAIELAKKHLYENVMPVNSWLDSNKAIEAFYLAAKKEALLEAADFAEGVTAYTQFQTVEHYKITAVIVEALRRMAEELK